MRIVSRVARARSPLGGKTARVDARSTTGRPIARGSRDRSGRDLDDARRARGASAGTSEGCFETREFLFTRVSLASRPRARVVDAASSTRSRDRSAPRERRRAWWICRSFVARAGLNEFAEKVSKGALSLGVAGAVLAQVRGVHSRARDTTAIR